MSARSGARGALLGFAAALLAAAVLLPGIAVPLHNVAEPLEGLVVQEMDRSGDWILPRRNAEEIPAKPPLYHWLALGVAGARGGIDEVAIRVPSVLASAIAVGATAFVACRFFGAAAGITAAVVLSSSPEWLEWSGYARTDALFTACLAIALLLGERWLSERSRSALLGAALALAAAALAKGPAAFVIAGAVLVVECLRRGEARRLASAELIAAGVLAAGIAGAWYVAAILRAGESFVEKQILAENVFRFLPSDDGGPSREHSIFFYVPALLAGMFPWALALPVAIRDAWREPGRAGAFARFAVVWIAVVFVLCSLADGKRANYVLPLFPPAAALIGLSVARALARGPEARGRAPEVVALVVAAPLALVGLALLAWSLGLEPWAPILPFLHPRDRVNVPATADAIGTPPLAVGILALALAAATLWTLRTRRHRPLAAIVGVVAILLATLGTGVLRPVEAARKTFREFAGRVSERIGADADVRFFPRPDYGLLFYLRRHVPVATEPEQAIGARDWLLVWEEDVERLPEPFRERLEVVDRSPPAAPHRPKAALLLARIRAGSL
jgi:4-amino-4-deoxy-L-arabinose transferase-like glycosyltransferase